MSIFTYNPTVSAPQLLGSDTHHVQSSEQKSEPSPITKLTTAKLTTAKLTTAKLTTAKLTTAKLTTAKLTTAKLTTERNHEWFNVTSSLSGLLVILHVILTLISLSSPRDALACGGLFCDTNQPVNQAAERILFAASPTGDMQMHVQIQYQGPPDEFSWLLPVPRGTEIGISRASLFPQLDQRYQPSFRLNRIRPTYCPPETEEFSQAGSTCDTCSEDSSDERVQVTSQSRVGPYDQVTLNAPSIDVLTDWLAENNYQVPPNAEETLSPYLEDYEFLALKLSAGRESGDIQPVFLLLPTGVASIPIRPTAVAATPDMGVLIHLIGPTRAVPTNYQLVELNYAALDWLNPATHYSTLVSHAVDQAEEGRAFVTDFAGAHEFMVDQLIPILSPSTILAMDEVRDGEALYQVLSRSLSESPQPDLDPLLLNALPLEREQALELLAYAREGLSIERDEVRALLREGETDDEGWIAVDGGAIAVEMRSYQRGGEALQQAFGDHPYLTRLYTTLSASEMNVDPTFDFNPDLSDVPSLRRADLHMTCNGEFDYLVTENGLEVDLGDGRRDILERQDGETIRSSDTLGASVIYRSMTTGQPEIIADYRAQLKDEYRRPIIDDSLGCHQSHHPHPSQLTLLILCALILSSLTRRRGQRDHL